jgi:hypothetical protein
MIPKGISHTSVQNPTYVFQKRNISSIQENLSSIQNYQGLSFLLVTFTGLADLFSQLRSCMKSFVGTLCVSALMVQWQNTCKWCRGAWVQIQDVIFITFSWWRPGGPRFKSGFHNSFWDYLVFLKEYHEWLWKYINKIWERVWLILFREYISPTLFAVYRSYTAIYWIYVQQKGILLWCLRKVSYENTENLDERSLELLIPGGARVWAARISSSGTWRPHPPLLIIEKSSQISLLTTPPPPPPPMPIILSKEVFSFEYTYVCIINV